MSTLPPLSAVRVFEAASRHLSFTRAAEELGMTQAAVSYQIRLLEERLGTALFLRLPRKLQLTEAGQRLAPDLVRAFGLIRAAFRDFDAEGPQSLVISTTQTFATQWLAPNLGSFLLRHPEIAVRVETDSRLVDFAASDVDVAVRQGNGSWPGLTAIHLADVRFTPLLSPALAESIGGVTRPADLLRLPLLDADDPWWTIWIEANQLSREALSAQRGPSLGTQSLIAAAAMAGLGVALLAPGNFSREIADGKLLRPFAGEVSEGSAFWLVYPEQRRNVPKIRRFRDWLVAEMARAGSS